MENLLLEFINWHNEQRPDNYIPNSEIGRFFIERKKDSKIDYCPSCGSDEVIIRETIIKLNRCNDCGVEWDINE